MKTKSSYHELWCTYLKRKANSALSRKHSLVSSSNGAGERMCSTRYRLGDSYLHATHSHTQGGRSALLTLLHLPSSLLLRGIISVLSGPHLQIKHTGKLEVMHHVLQQEELWERRQGELNCQRRCSPGQPGRGTRPEIGLGGKQIGTEEDREQTVWEGDEKGQNPSSGTWALAPCRRSQPGKCPAQH